MSKNTRRTLSVLLLTAATAAAVWGGVAVAETTGATNSASTTASSVTLTCPRTGCTASTCHATTGAGIPGGRGGH